MQMSVPTVETLHMVGPFMPSNSLFSHDSSVPGFQPFYIIVYTILEQDISDVSSLEFLQLLSLEFVMDSFVLSSK